jgi:hypothetical protein
LDDAGSDAKALVPPLQRRGPDNRAGAASGTDRAFHEIVPGSWRALESHRLRVDRELDRLTSRRERLIGIADVVVSGVEHILVGFDHETG